MKIRSHFLRKPLSIFAFLILISSSIFAQKDGVGLGVIVGEPTGISFKRWTGDRNAVDGALAWSFKDPEALHIHADYLWHFMDVIQVDEGQLPLYVGVGGKIRFADDFNLGIRVPFGITYLFEGAPLDVFLEVVPILDLTPATDFDFNAAIGIRYYLGH